MALQDDLFVKTLSLEGYQEMMDQLHEENQGEQVTYEFTLDEEEEEEQ